MINPYINIYKDDPTVDGVDGTAVSFDNSYTTAISFSLDAEQNESRIVKCAIRTEEGYQARNVTLSDVNDTNDRFKLCKTENGTFADEISFDQIINVNTIFYVKASSQDTEPPQVDRSVKIHFYGKIVAV